MIRVIINDGKKDHKDYETAAITKRTTMFLKIVCKTCRLVSSHRKLSSI